MLHIDTYTSVTEKQISEQYTMAATSDEIEDVDDYKDRSTIVALKSSPSILRVTPGRHLRKKQQSLRSIMQIQKASLGQRVHAHAIRAKTNMPPETIQCVGPQKVSSVTVQITNYNESKFKESRQTKVCESDENLDHVIELCDKFVSDKESVTWIHVIGLHDARVIQRLGKLFNLHPLLQEDICETSQLTKIEEFNGYMSIFANMIFPQIKRRSMAGKNKNCLLCVLCCVLFFVLFFFVFFRFL